MRYKVEFRPRPELLALDTGDNWQGFPIAASIPGERQAIIEFPDEWTDMMIEAFLRERVAAGDVVDFRPEHRDYRILGFLDVATRDVSTKAIGDTFSLHGVNADVLARGKNGQDILLAVCDTGVDNRHVAFSGVQVIGDGAGNDGHGHGTHCASTAASAWGIAKAARIYAGKALEDNGTGTETQVANSIRAAAEAGAQVISLSLGGSGSQVIDDACNYAKTLGSIVVAAAGNSPAAAIGSPARAADLIVMAHDRGRNWASFTSGRGWPNANRIGFNGVRIDAARANSGNGVATMSGTSMATPHNAGAAALLRAGGESRTSAIAYLLSHRLPPPDGPGTTIVAADFGATLPPPPPPPNETDQQALDRILGRVRSITVSFNKPGVASWVFPTGD